MDYYESLGVNRNASAKEIKSAFRKKAAEHHPDKGGDPNQFKQINEAYQTLSNNEKRSMYDQFGTADLKKCFQVSLEMDLVIHFNADKDRCVTKT